MRKRMYRFLCAVDRGQLRCRATRSRDLPEAGSAGEYDPIVGGPRAAVWVARAAASGYIRDPAVGQPYRLDVAAGRREPHRPSIRREEAHRGGIGASYRNGVELVETAEIQLTLSRGHAD